MKQYFKKMTPFGKPVSDKQKEKARQSAEQIHKAENEVSAAVESVMNIGNQAETNNKKKQMTIWQRIEYLIDPGTWCPLHALYNPNANTEGTTGVVDGLAKINGKWAVIIGFNNKVMAGAMLSGQAENQIRVTDISKRLNIPLVWLVNCSGVKLTEQQEIYAGRRGGGTPFFRNAELSNKGIPIIGGIYGTNPAGGGYQAISPAIILAHKEANMAIGGKCIVEGMTPKGSFDQKGAERLIDMACQFNHSPPPGGSSIHYDKTGFFSELYETEQGVLDGIKKYMDMIPAYDPNFFCVAEPKEPKFAAEDLYYIIPHNQKRGYPIREVLARIFDNSEHMEFRPDYGPEVYTGLAKINGLLTGFIANCQGFLGRDYPEYSSHPGIGGKLYRQGLIKMNEFVTLCGRDRIPLIWIQDTSGIDVGDDAERAELLGLGQSLAYSIEQTDIPQICIVLRKGSAAAHYIMGGPTANNHNAFTLGTPTTEIYVMHGETAAAVQFSRKLVKEKEQGRPLQPVVDKMNEMIDQYHDCSRPIYCASRGFVDGIVPFSELRRYIKAFTGCSYQNPGSICPHHHMILPRLIKG